MDVEFEAWWKQRILTLVPSPNVNLVGCKWVYKLKLHHDGTIACYKARVVAKRFPQQARIDYTETFSLVVKPAIVRIVLAIAISSH